MLHIISSHLTTNSYDNKNNERERNIDNVSALYGLALLSTEYFFLFIDRNAKKNLTQFYEFGFWQKFTDLKLQIISNALTQCDTWRVLAYGNCLKT